MPGVNLNTSCRRLSLMFVTDVLGKKSENVFFFTGAHDLGAKWKAN